MKNRHIPAVFLAALMLTGCGKKNSGNAEQERRSRSTEPSVTQEFTVPAKTAVSTETTTTETVTETVPPAEAEVDPDAPPFAEMLSDDTARTYYKEIYRKLSGGGTTVKFYDLWQDKGYIQEVFDLMQEKNGEFFWLKHQYNIDWYKYPAHVNYYYMDGLTLHKMRNMQIALEQAAAELIAQIPQGASDYDKVLAVHDYLLENVEYDYESKESREYTDAHTAYGALVNGRAVCSGYSYAFLYIMNRLGIDAGYCYGPSGEEADLSHAWNYVKLNGKYYWLDITWDDDNYAAHPEDGLRYDYFLLDDETFLQSHTNHEDVFFVPKCDSLASNYHRLNNSYVTEYDFNTVADIFDAHAEDEVVQIMFGSADALNAAIADLFTNGGVTDIPAVPQGSQISYYQNEKTHVLVVRFPAPEEAPAETQAPEAWT